jgi:hypothetical protein
LSRMEERSELKKSNGKLQELFLRGSKLLPLTLGRPYSNQLYFTIVITQIGSCIDNK